jgi:glycerol-3-phosphate acyltransferase PlsY
MSWLEQFRATNWGEVGLSAIGAYVLGCFATGYYLVRAVRGTDIRTVASGSVGARNVSRVLGRTGFLLTTLGDALKGSLAVWATQRFFPDDRLAIAALLAVVAGHIWPVQLRFRGGKGVATSIGALLVYDWRLLVVYGAVFASGLLLARKTVLPGLFAFGCLPAAAFWLHRDGFELAMLTFLAGMVWFAHRTNLADEILALAARRGNTPKPEHPDP